MADLKSATCKYCKMSYRYYSDSYYVVCPHCKKNITTPAGTKHNISLGLNIAGKMLARMLNS